jgi:hypothetical protein
MRLITTFPVWPFNRRAVRRCAPRSIVGVRPIVARSVGRDGAADHCRYAISDDATKSGASAASRSAEFSLRRIFQAIGCLPPVFLKVRPAKSVLLRSLHDVVEQYSLDCHNITKTNAIFPAKNDVNKETLTIFQMYILLHLSRHIGFILHLIFEYTSKIY